MNPILEALHERKSVRVYTEQEISKEDKEAILNAALQAPTAGCQILYTILDITAQEKKEKLAELCDHQAFIAKGKLVLVGCSVPTVGNGSHFTKRRALIRVSPAQEICCWL